MGRERWNPAPSSRERHCISRLQVPHPEGTVTPSTGVKCEMSLECSDRSRQTPRDSRQWGNKPRRYHSSTKTPPRLHCIYDFFFVFTSFFPSGLIQYGGVATPAASPSPCRRRRRCRRTNSTRSSPCGLSRGVRSGALTPFNRFFGQVYRVHFGTRRLNSAGPPPETQPGRKGDGQAMRGVESDREEHRVQQREREIYAWLLPSRGG
jgi:hypothetical protein